MKFQRSIKRKTVLLFASFTLFLTVIYSLFTFLFAYIVEDDVIDKLLAKESIYLQQQYAMTGEFPLPRLDYMLHYPSIEKLPEFVLKVLLENPGATEVFTEGHGHFHISKLHLRNDQAETNNNLDSYLVADVTGLLSVRNLSGGLILLMAGALLLVMLLAIWLAYRIASIATLPILQLTQELLTQQNSSQPLCLNSKNNINELGFLATSIESSLNNLNAALQRESDFTRDVSHELRTPLTVLKNTLVLIDQRELQNEDKERLDQVATQMQTTVSILLALARQESLDTTSLLIRPIFEGCILALYQKLERRGFTVDLHIQDDCLVEGNHSLIILLVNNLIENAIQHASETSLNISRQDNALVFENKNHKPLPYNLTDQLTKTPESEGLGQGLYLVKRIAYRLNWELKVETVEQSFKIILLPNWLSKPKSPE
ncbi:MAG: signal transduction histidine kinase [Paraglaciecola sp.]|jgi:signal transduction histidine kinase